MKKQIGKNLMQKWKNKIRVRLSALDKKKLVLTNIPYILTAFYTNRASFLYRNSLGEDIGNKLLYAMEHADRILTGLQPSFNWRDMLTGIVAAVILKLLVWQKQSDAKKLRKGIEYGSARWGNAEDIKPYMSEDPWMNIPLTATEALTMESRPKQPKYARNKNIVVIGGSGSGKTRFFVKPSVMQMNCSMVITDPKGTLIEECGKMLAKGPPKKDKNGNIMKDKSGKVVHEPYVITARSGDDTIRRIIMIPTSGFPDDRESAAVNSVVKDRASFVEYIAFVLGDDYVASMLEGKQMGESGFFANSSDAMPALYEKMLKTSVEGPERIKDIGYVLKMVTDKDIIPDEFRELYETFCNTLKIRR
ncbi:hypothetical protein JCM37173_18350 [Allocoprococcus similis]